MTTPGAQLVVLVRHAEASPVRLESGRPLTARGRRQAEATAAWLVGLRLPLAEIRHSGKLRAQQTAAAIGRQLGLPALAAPGLAPRDTAAAVRAEIEAEGANVVMVGHGPNLSDLASVLLGAASAAFRFDEATAAVLRREGSGWRLVGSFTPRTHPR